MEARDLIAALRGGAELTAEDLVSFAQGLADRRVSDAQAGAFAMAVCLQGLSTQACTALTLAMRDTGTVLSWDLPGPVVDKHSTGGVGDCVSLVLAPALAACGAYVPMISGRGLGHTGGTLDKLEAIPGLSVNLDQSRLHATVKEVGCAIVGASADIAPADKRLYAIRDVTATVESLELITASILSKKLAAGTDALVLDVKLGSGAFMKSHAEAEALARRLVDTANAAGCPTSALITDMNAPLAPALGNALEVEAVMRALTDPKGQPLLSLSVALGAEVLLRCGQVASLDEGERKLRHALDTGAAAEVFGRMVYAQGGPKSFAENWRRFLPEAPVIAEVAAPASGYVTGFDGTALGHVVVALGGGRLVERDIVNPAVGLSDVVALGAWVEKGAPLARVHAAREDAARAAARQVRAAITLGDQTPKPGPLVRDRVAP